MTNHDFWMSISDIINEGFTSEGLAKLDDYAEQFSTGKILYKRFSPSEQLGCVKGGTIHVIAPYSREQKLAQINSLRQKAVSKENSNLERSKKRELAIIEEFEKRGLI